MTLKARKANEAAKSLHYKTAEAADLPALKPLWTEFYAGQKKLGLRWEIPADGFQSWADALAPSLNRFTSVFVALDEGAPVAFVVGRIRVQPEFLGGKSVGFISEVFVLSAYRGLGIAQKLLNTAKQWFISEQVARMELHVFPKNQRARDFYARGGWEEELIQLVLPLS